MQCETEKKQLKKVQGHKLFRIYSILLCIFTDPATVLGTVLGVKSKLIY